MLEVANDKLTDRERECVKHIRQARERGMSFAEYCRSAGLKANEWHGVRHGMVKKKLLPPGPGSRPKSVRSCGKPARFIPVHVESSSGTGSSIGRDALPSASSVRLYHRVCQLAGAQLDEGTAGGTTMMRPYGEDLKIHLCREPIDMRKYVLTNVMRC